MQYPPEDWTLPERAPEHAVNEILESINRALDDFIKQKLPKLVHEAEVEMNKKLVNAKVGAEILGGLVVKGTTDAANPSNGSVFLLYEPENDDLKVPEFGGGDFPYVRMKETGFKFANLRAIVEIGRKANFTRSADPILDIRGTRAFSMEIVSETPRLLLRLGVSIDETHDEGSTQTLVHVSSKTAPNFGFYGHWASSRSGGFLVKVGTEGVFVPLGPTPLALIGVAVMYGERFGPDIKKSIADPIEELRDATIPELVAWARVDDLNKWAASKTDIRAYGLQTILGDVFSAGHLVRITEVGFTYVSVGPMIWLGGKLFVLGTGPYAETVGVIDSRSSTIFLKSSIAIAPISSFKDFVIKGGAELQLSMSNPDAWYFAIGGYAMDEAGLELPWFKLKGGARITTRHVAAAGQIYSNWTANAFGASIGYEGRIALYGMLGWNPVQVEAALEAALTVFVKVFGQKVGLGFWGGATIRFPSPFALKLEGKASVDLPWPLGDLEFRFTILNVGGQTDQPSAPESNLQLAADQVLQTLHPPSGITGELCRQEISQTWPDSELTIPFRRTALDKGGVVTPSDANAGSFGEGGIHVQHEITAVSMVAINVDDPTKENPVAIKGFWRGVASGEGFTDSAVLQIPSGSPLGWSNSFEYAAPKQPIPERHWTHQYFGRGVTQKLPAPASLYLAPFSITSTYDMELVNLPSYEDSRALHLKASELSLHMLIDKVPVPILAGEIALTWVQSAGVKVVIPIDANVYTITRETLKPLEFGFELTAYIIERKDKKAFSKVQIGNMDGHDSHFVGVGYRPHHEAPTDDAKQVLSVGRYRLELDGKSTASFNGRSATTQWAHTAVTFDVIPPPLRPYIYYATIGDERNFGMPAESWYPSPVGIGLPHYQDYFGAIRFRVQYMDKIYPQLFVKTSDDAAEVPVKVGAGAAAPNELAGLPWAWLAINGISVQPSECVFAIPKTPGAHRISIYRPGLKDPKERELVDSWTYLVSRFRTPSEHLTPVDPGVTRVYGRFGCQHLTASRTAKRKGKPAKAAYRQGWSLPTNIFLGVPKRGNAALEYLRLFEHARVFDVSGLNVGDSPAVPAAETGLSLLLGRGNQCIALVVRTPEPLDWRRATAIAILDAGSGALSEFNTRILPSPDGCSAALVLEADGVPMEMPSGLYELQVQYGSFFPKLPGLRHESKPGDVSRVETVTWSFSQPYGKTW